MINTDKKMNKIKIVMTKSEPKRYPKPSYCFCNKGHPLQEVYNEIRNCYEWDCPKCIQAMIRRGEVESNLNKIMYGSKPLQDIKW